MTYQSYTQVELVDSGKQLGFCDSGTEEWAQHLWVILKVYTERSRGTACNMPFKGMKTLKRARADRALIHLIGMQMWADP